MRSSTFEFKWVIACPVETVPTPHINILTEQISVRIVQIMIQTPDLAKYSMGVTLKKTNAGHAKFQYF